MYNLLVAGDCNAWKAKTYSLDIDRCIQEYTSNDLVKKFSRLDETAIEKLKSFPCLFAYEDSCSQPPRFGWFKNLKKRSSQVIMECEYIEIEPWVFHSDLHSIKANLDIYGWELSRTHWAVKNVDLVEELAELGVSIPVIKTNRTPTVNPEYHMFDVSFSFPGEAREFVEQVLRELGKWIDPNDLFYDNHFKAFLARPNLDILLSKVYREQSKLIVVFLSGDYQRKSWPGIEFRTIREIIFEKQHNRVMYIRMDDVPVDGVLKTDGYIDARIHTAQEVASFIYQRVSAQRLYDSKS